MVIHDSLNSSTTYNSIFVLDGDDYTPLDKGDIFYIKSHKNYCRIYALKRGKFFIVRGTMNNMLEIMGDAFCRIHDQYIIASSQVARVPGELTTVILKCEEELPIGRTYLPGLKKALNLLP